MRFSFQLSTMLLCLLLCGSCNEEDELFVAKKNFESEVEQLQNLVFSFNKDVYPDTLLQCWDSSAYIEFTPKIRGQFKWNSSSELVFSPAEKLAPGTDYTARLTPQLTNKAKQRWPIRKEEIRFHTAPLRVTGSTISWTRGKAMSNTVVQIDFDFNYEVEVSEAATHIQLKSGDKTLSPFLTNGGRSRKVSLQFSPVNELDEETPLQATITKGIPVTATYTSSKDTQLNLLIPSRYNMTITGMSGHHNGAEGTILVYTSQPVAEEGLKSYVTIVPSVPFEITLSDMGFIITSNALKAEQQYEVTISKHLEGAFGGRMKRDHYEQIGFGKLEPAVNFLNSKGMYLSSAGFKNLALNIVNVPKVAVTVVKVYENNLEELFRRGIDYGYDWSEDDAQYYRYYNTHNLGDTVYQQTYETIKLPRNNSARVLHLDFKDRIRQYDGIYVISVASTEHNWVQESKILTLSDIGLIVKEDKHNTYVFANSIREASPIAGVQINFISSNNQRLYSGVTNSEGIAVFEDKTKRAPGFQLGHITAKKGEEFSFIKLSQSRVETSRFDVGGYDSGPAGLNAMIYAERNLYRPGETMYVTTVVRDEQRGQVGEIPVKFRLVMPNGKEFATMRKILNNEGSAETSFSLPPSARTGTYNMELLSGNDVLLNSYRISVEDFIPDRIKLTVNLNKSAYAAGDTIQAFLKADNLFGTPAADRNFEATVNMSKVRFSPKGFDDYNFNLKNNFHFNTEVKTGKTNDKGLAAVAFQLKPEMKEVGMIQGNVTATVFDETGRPVHRFEHFKVYTQPVFVGLKLKDEYVSTRKPMKISLVTVDKKGNPRSNVPVQLTLIKLEWHTVIEKNGASYKYVSRKQEKTMKQQRLTTSATGAAFAFTPELSGEYELRASLEGSNSYVSQTFYAYGWGDTEYSSFEVNNEGHISITTGKDKYQAGEDIDVLFSTPFDGRMLVTMERNSILKHFYLETENKTASVKLKADEACIPNVYVTATLIRPMDESDLPLTIAHGFRSVTVENKDYQLPVQVTVSEQTRSRSAQTVTVKTAPGAMVTIAAVDEGILQIKNYKTPDPHQWFYQKQALTTGNYDIYPLLLPEVKTRFSSTGGDGSDESEMRVNPMFVNRVKNVSYWSGIQQADANGIVRYKLNIPQFSGDLRVMAAAYKGKGFGAKEEHIKVADPIVVSVGLPRFLSPGDEVLVPVTLSNTTTKTAAATVRLELTGPLRVLGNATENINVSGNRDGRVVFRIGATEAVGAGKVLVTVSAMKEKFLHETELSIRPPASLQKISQNGIATAQAPASILIPNKFIPSTARSTILFGNNPMVQFTKNLSDLVNYPYGCLEQTVSAAFPQLYYKDLVMSLERRDDKDPNPAYNVQQAINKIQGMQLEDGSLSFWPGTWSNNWWGSVYAAHFLLEAKKAGFEVNHRMIEGLLSFLKHRLGRKETEMLHYNGNQMRKIAAKEICYSLYILANAGQTQLSTMNYYKAHLDELSIDSKYLLAAAYTRAGMPTQAREVLPASFSGEQANQSLGGNFYSWIRDEAISLNAMLDTDPTNPQIAVMAQHLSQQMKEQPYLNTQENAFGILALGKLSRLANQTTGTAILTYEGKQLASSKGPATKTKLNNHIGASINLGVQGKGTYYYTWEVSGITADGSYVQEDRYIKVRRSFYTRNGQQITNNSFRQNDLIIVKLSIESLQGRAIENVAITDMLPAGLEIENSRLVELPGMEWIKDPAVADYLDIRDDRLNLFTTVTPKRQDFWYMARAVSPGTYKLGPVMADAMYNGAFHSYHGAGTITVREQ